MAESGSGRMMLYVVVAFVIFAAIVIAGTIVIERRMELRRPQPIVSPAPSTVAATPDSSSTTDTAFDINRPPRPPQRLWQRLRRSASPCRRTARCSRPATASRRRDAPGYVRVFARGGTARVRIDGRMYGFSPLIVRVGPGAHVVSLESSGNAFLPAQITVSVVSNDTVAAIFSARLSATDGPAHDRRPAAAGGAAVPATTPVGAAPDHQTDGSGAGAPASPPPSSSSGEPTPP